MNKQSLMVLLNTVSEDNSTIDTILQLGPYIDDEKVVDVLFRKAIETDDYLVREALIKTLKGNPYEANRRFTRIAICAKDPIYRRWAFINLSLMGCSNAKDAVMQGLRDPQRSVRIAAALNIGLYCESDVVNELELFFERNRHFLVFDSFCRAVKSLWSLIIKFKRHYRDNFHCDDTKTRKDERIQTDTVLPVFD